MGEEEAKEETADEPQAEADDGIPSVETVAQTQCCGGMKKSAVCSLL